MQPLSVFLIEDDPGVTISLLAALGLPGSGFAPCGATTNAELALDVIIGNTVDLFIVDWMLPGGMDGLEFIVRLKLAAPQSRAVLLTGHPSRELTLRAIAAGADGILYKPFDIPELLRSLRAAYHGHCVVTAEATGHLVDRLRELGAFALTDDDGPLTKREAEALQLLGTGLTAKEVGDCLNLSPETIATYRKQAFKKLGVHKLPEAMTKLRAGGGAESGEIARRE